jgi:hypothetical protein
VGFNKRYVNYQSTLRALQSGSLKKYYGNSDALIFQDDESLMVNNLFDEGKSDEEILLIIKQNEEK